MTPGKTLLTFALEWRVFCESWRGSLLVVPWRGSQILWPWRGRLKIVVPRHGRLAWCLMPWSGMLPDALAWHVVLCPGAALKIFRALARPTEIYALAWHAECCCSCPGAALGFGPGVAYCFCAGVLASASTSSAAAGTLPLPDARAPWHGDLGGGDSQTASLQ